MTDDSSSSDEENDRVREAIDPSFLNLYSKNDQEIRSKQEEEVIPSKSLRNKLHIKTEPINPFTIKVTPEFRNHVARHLAKILDDIIQDEDVRIQSHKRKNKHKSSGGVKLLRTSNDYLTTTSCKVDNFMQKKPCQKSSLKNSDFEKRAKEVAVSGEWILSQKETEHWAIINKGTVEVIKLSKKSMKLP